jgi:starvation-inducible DNA-binding protein
VTTSLSSQRRNTHEINMFHGPHGFYDDLQAVLVDLIELQLQAKQVHWNVVGTNFRDLHLQLDSVVDAARASSDAIAERMRALDGVPDARSDTVVATTTVPAIPQGLLGVTQAVEIISTRIYAAVSTMRAVHDGVDAADPSTADLFHVIIERLEKEAWLLKSENGTA